VLGLRFINGISRVQQKRPSDPTLSQKRAVFPAFSSREVTLGQMRKIGIHFIIYRKRRNTFLGKTSKTGAHVTVSLAVCRLCDFRKIK